MSAVSTIEGANHAKPVGVWCLHRKRNAFRPSLSSPGGMLIESLRWRQHEPVGVARPATGQGLGRHNRPTLIAAVVALIRAGQILDGRSDASPLTLMLERATTK